MKPLALALDLGSTRIKAGLLAADGRIEAVRALPAPPLRGTAGVREGDALAYVEIAERVLSELARAVPAATPLGIASQRSSFLLWDRSSGRPRTPLISWQDRRAAGWCARHADRAAEVSRRTGLALSAHYVGPKLAALSELETRGRPPLQADDVLFGTLDCYLAWRLGRGRPHEIDLTMAARTALVDLAHGGWGAELLQLFGVPRRILPAVRPTCRVGPALAAGPTLRATIADQAAGVLALVEGGSDSIAVILGTGAFVQRPADRHDLRRTGYLTAPILAREGRPTRYALEGTVNGAGSAVDRFGPGPTELPLRDPTPDALCLPDVAGLGSPFWRADVGLTFSDGAARLDAADLRRVTLEGLLFRLRQVIEDLTADGASPERVLLAGGLSREPFVGPALAAVLGRTVEQLEVTEGVLLATARLAAGLEPYRAPATRRFSPGAAGSYLDDKYGRWRTWIDGVLARGNGPPT